MEVALAVKLLLLPLVLRASLSPSLDEFCSEEEILLVLLEIIKDPTEGESVVLVMFRLQSQMYASFLLAIVLY